ncbi:hypothetical protein MMC30_006748 [Trapelia coarctata]|nr:hypothetical protein [Trapelia coarctata]
MAVPGVVMEDANDDFKWFGEGFDGFPKRLPDDSIEYNIYLLDQDLQDSEVREKLRSVQSSATTLIRQVLKDFIWQRESFVLELVREDDINHLRGRTNYGDSVEDEWLIVYLLRELSTQYPDIWVKAIDTDGEFLLIEAANTLPKWLNPEVADNRVWLNNGQLLIIPMLSKQAESKGKGVNLCALRLKEAFTFIRSGRSQLMHSPLVEAEAFYRLRNYPQQIHDSLHHARVILPRKLAYLLHQDAAYIGPAVEAFYLRDPIALRPLQAKIREQLILPPEDLVGIGVKFTKVGFAQLKSQQFPVPPAWARAFAASNHAFPRTQLELGMKVTCGFEMLLSDPQNQDKRPVREMKLLLDDVQRGEDQLPEDSEISTWTSQEDSEAWLDINFEDFDNELSGKGKEGAQPGADGGFGDKSAQENLRKMVARFEEFLNDDAAGSDGAEFIDDMNVDTDDEDKEDRGARTSDAGEDKEISFDEGEFDRMMREMMGMPADSGEGQSTAATAANAKLASTNPTNEGDASDDDDEEEIRRITQAMEIELKEAGALRLNSGTGDRQKQLPSVKDRIPDAAEADEFGEENASHEELDIDFNLAKNMLESFKSQAGMAGPGGNLMGMMGMRLPRDEEDDRPGPSSTSDDRKK